VGAYVSRRWAGLLLGLVVVVAVCALAARWQWHRYEERVARNAALDAAATTAPVPVDELLEVGAPAPPAVEYRQVRARGSYDAARVLALRLRPLDGEPGSHELVPLRTASGAALLVDRGWFADRGQGSAPPPPPDGEVEVTVRLRLDEASAGGADGLGGDPAEGSIRFVDIGALGEQLPYPLYGAWGELVTEQPRPADAPVPVPAPQRGTGPHLPYAAQWVAFAVMAFGGFVLLARQDLRRRRDGEEPREVSPPARPAGRR
jgi:cytochrome oxidase assembly protein ShyY1